MTKFEVENRSGELIIRWKNRPKMRWFLLFFAVFWNGVLLVVFAAMGGSDDFPWWIGFHVLAGLLVGYFCLVLFINKRSINAGRNGLMVRGGPLPTLGQNQEYRFNEVDQLYVKQSGSSTVNGKTTHYYALTLRTKKGKDKNLAGWLKQSEALDLERRIEDHLGIEDAPIPIEGRALDMLRKWKPEWAEMAEEMHKKQQGKSVAFTARPRRIAGPERDYAPALQHAEPGYLINLRGNNLAMTEGQQTDWEDPTLSDRRLSVYDATASENYYLYCEQNDDGWQYYEERPLAREEYDKIGWSAEENLPQRLENGDELFRLRDERTGKQFSMPGSEIEEVQQRVYQNVNAKTRFRVQWRKGREDYMICIQELLQAADIGDVLAD